MITFTKTGFNFPRFRLGTPARLHRGRERILAPLERTSIRSLFRHNKKGYYYAPTKS